MKKLLIASLYIVLTSHTVNAMEEGSLQPEKIKTSSMKVSSYKPVEAEENALSDQSLQKVKEQIKHYEDLQKEAEKSDPLVKEVITNHCEQYLTDLKKLDGEINSDPSRFTDEFVDTRLYKIDKKNSLYANDYY